MGMITQSEDRRWNVLLNGFADHEVSAPTMAKAKYIDWKAAREAGYFTGRDGFYRYLTEATLYEVIR